MATKGFYPVSAVSPDHEIRKANGARACWGAEVKVQEFWLPVNAPLCTGSIQPGDYYLVHDDRRDHLHRVNSCLKCVVYYHLAELEGEWHQFIPATQEELDATKRELRALLDDLNNMEPL